jgi:PAS domain S-box-containing protein
MQDPAQTPSEVAPAARAPRSRRGHLRLILFFVAIALACGAFGVKLLEGAHDERQRAAILIACVVSACAFGLGGVLFHRLRMIHLRWVETDEYLARIRRESAKYRALLEGAADMLLLVDPDGRVHEQNAIARRALGLGRSQAEGMRLDGIVAADDLAGLRSALETALADPGRPVAHGELRVLDEGGEPLAVDARVVAIDLEESRVLLLALRDLTARKQMEHQLLVRERLSSLGLLTAGVAHEINNPLEGIGNYLSLLQRDNLDEERRRRYLEQVRHGFERIRDIVADLLRFARPGAHGGQADLGQVVERSLAMAAYAKVFREVAVERRGLETPLPVTGDAGRLEQVVLNLLLNAATAMHGTGRIVLTGSRAPESAGGPQAVELRVEDEGPGIEPSQLDQLFDPFFSGHGGTGLGLSVSYGIVTAHGGTLTARNREPRGACFTIRLPAAAPADAGVADEARASAKDGPADAAPLEHGR